MVHPMNTTPDWPQIIKDINAAGLTYREIGETVGGALGTIGDLARGKSRDATYTLGASLLALHKRTARKRRHTASAVSL